jgi:sodium transport system permease protein
MTLVAVLYPCFFLAQGLLAQYSNASLTKQYLLSGLELTVVFLCLPLLITWWTNRRFITTYQLHVPSPLALLGAVLLGVSLWPFAHELFLLAQRLGFSTMTPDLMRELTDQLAERSDDRHAVPFGVIVFATALAPAVAEEFCFRGYFQTALQQKLPAWGAILITAAVFGVFHISVGGLIILERVLSSAALGLLLGWLCWQTRSLWPGILLHCVHNGFLQVLDRYQKPIGELWFIQQLGWNQENVTHLPGMLLGIAAVVGGCGLVLVWVGRGRLSSLR